MNDWTPFDDAPSNDLKSFDDWTPLQRDVSLKGSVLVVVRARDGSPRVGKKVIVRGCGFL